MIIDLTRQGDTVSGQVSRDGGPSHPFSGWVTLFALLDRLLGGEGGTSPPPEPGEPLHRPHGTGQTLHGGHGACTVLLGDAESGGAYSALELVLPPGGEEPVRSYHNQDLGLYVVEGEGLFQLGARSVVGHTGDFFNVPRGSVYAVRNNGSAAARLLLTLVPAGGPSSTDAFSARVSPDDEVVGLAALPDPGRVTKG